MSTLHRLLGSTFFIFAAFALAAADEVDRSWQPIHRNGDETLWRNIESSAEYVEFASGLNFLNEVGQWEDSFEEIILLPEGDAAALKGQHRVFFAPNLNSTGAIQFLSREGRPFCSHPLGLYYFCAATGRSARVASVQDSIGELLPPNQILYPNAFLGANVRGDIRFTYTKAGFESCANDRLMTHLGGGKGVTLQRKEWSVTWIVQMK